MNIQGKYIKYEDYVALEEKCAALSDDNDKAMEAMKQANEAVKLAHSKYSKLASENAALKSALNNILQPDAAVLERNHRARALDAMETPATDDFLAEVRAQGVEMFSEKFGGGTQLSDMVKEVAADFAAKLRKGAAQ
ncbi:TPA: hypothetical protein N3G02_005362 [Salmonella enterica subsp. enterica serovar Newport]|nr:hypothetical protein [Salmonella enterica subsp. enterica serovar Newport]EIR7959204.1 hypothetical protein [Salmonella enterica subsp. enterica serovar Newport]EIY8026382.1 hypothetical protein [Salmonella enterica subsp. enterica serovar Newport]EJP4120278.1 hypothetical protein [Salmonella enterica subsp. enterica serovar Newport]EJR8050951.1 hypothetical protein [Salmonella enterica subsp. enterica serovar Newport]